MTPSEQEAAARRASLWQAFDNAVRAGDADGAIKALRGLFSLADEPQRKEQS